MSSHLVKNPVARAVLGGLAAALVVAAPLASHHLGLSDFIAIAVAGLSGSGLVAVPTGREVAAEETAAEAPSK